MGTTTTFSITCTGPGGAATASTTVTIVSGVAPATPTNLVVVTGAQCGGTIDLSWSAVAGATFYNVLRNGTLVGTTTGTSFTDTATSVGNPFTYTVQAVNAFGASAISNSASALSSGPCATGGGGGGGSTFIPSAGGEDWQAPFIYHD